MSFKPYTSLVPLGITWFKDLEDFGKKSSGGVLSYIPGDTKRPYRPWTDTQLVNQTQDFFTNFYGQTSTIRTYNFIARDSSGYPKTTPVGSPEFLKTYDTGVMNPPNVRTFVQYSYMFPNGVPFIEPKNLFTDLDKLGEPNFKGYTPGYDYPVLLKPDDMLLIQNGEVVVINCYDFAKLVSVRDVSDDQKLELVSKILARTDMTSANKVKAINDVTMRANISVPVI